MYVSVPLRLSVALVACSLVTACRVETGQAGQDVVQTQRGAESETSSTGTQGRAPVAVVLFSGRIAYPHVSLTTWGACPFIIERVQRLDRSLLVVVGREADSGCETEGTRHRVTERLTRVHATGGEHVERVLVVSRDPGYRLEARVEPFVA